MKPLCQICTPVGMLGYGFDEGLLRACLEHMATARLPTAIILDSGSTDSGPSKLALGTMTVPRSSYKRDLTMLLRAVLEFRVPLLTSSVGGSGSNEHVDEFLEIIREVAAELKSSRPLKVLAIYSEISKQVILRKLAQGQISGCGLAVPTLTGKIVEQTSRILGQMGPEPLLDAMEANPDFDVLIAGRAYDPAPYVAYCVSRMERTMDSPLTMQDVSGLVLGGFYHMGKIMECGGLCATPKSHSAKATVYEDGTFDIAPMDAVNARCTPLSVAAHTLYENARPDILHGPGGYLDLTESRYESLHDVSNSVRVGGGQFTTTDSPDAPWTLKLEGALLTGFRTLFMGSFRDSILTAQVDDFLAVGKEKIRKQFASCAETWTLDFHVYGRPAQNLDSPGELFVVGEALAPTQDLATSIASAARIHCIHGSYEGQVGTGGNFAFGLGGQMEIPAGPCCEFSIYHVVNLTHGERKSQQISDEASKVASVGNADQGLFSWHMKTVMASTSSPPTSYYDTPIVRPVTTANRSAIKPPPTDNFSSINPSNIHYLRDIAKVIRSKNAGPYELTFDIMFDREDVYRTVKHSGLLSRETMATLLGRAVEEIVWCGFFDQALAFKVTFPRPGGKSSGGYMEDDVHGSQQYIPLLGLPLGEEVVGMLKEL